MSTDAQTPGVALLLSQLGVVAADRFAAALTELAITPPQAGLLRRIADGEPRSQQQLAAELGSAPSRIVAYLDDLEQRGVVRRRPGSDRRVNLVSLTEDGRLLMKQLARVARSHDRQVTAALSPQERQTLRELLTATAAGLGVTPGVHPGYAASAGDSRASSRR